MDQIEKLELQIEKLKKRLAENPEKINNRWNPRHFALKGKIRQCMEAKQKLKMIKWWAQ